MAGCRAPATFPFVASLDHLGPLARSVADLALSYDAMLGRDDRDPAQADMPRRPATPALEDGAEGLRIARLGGYFARFGEPGAFAALESSPGRSRPSASSSLRTPKRPARPPISSRWSRAARCISSACARGPGLRSRRARPADRRRDAARRLGRRRRRSSAACFRPRRSRCSARSTSCSRRRRPAAAPKIGQKTFVLDGKEMLVRPNIGIFTQPISFIGLPVVAVPVWTRARGCRSACRSSRRRGARILRCASRARSSATASSARRSQTSDVRTNEPGRTTPDGPNRNGAKAVVRDRVWRGLVEAQVNVGPAFDRIPNFVGADAAAKRLSELDEWRRARIVKCNPDPPQIPVRLRALYDGKLLFSPVPYLTKGVPYLRIDPDKLAAKGVDFETAATAQGFMQHGEPVGFEEMPKLDFCVVGCVAVTRSGGRTGKGAGFRGSGAGALPRAWAGRLRDADRDDRPFLPGRRRFRGGDGEP